MSVHHFERAWSADTDRLKTVPLRDLTQKHSAGGVSNCMRYVYNFVGWILTWKNFTCHSLSDLINWNQATDRHTSFPGSRAGAPVCQRVNPAIAVVRYWWCRAVGFIRAAVGCVCAVRLSRAVCALAIWHVAACVWLQDDTYMIRPEERVLYQ